jgi:hypothetical protein
LEPQASYTIRGDEGYVRARVLESNGRRAWIQPVMLASPTPALPPVAWLLSGLVLFASLVQFRRRQ